MDGDSCRPVQRAESVPDTLLPSHFTSGHHRDLPLGERLARSAVTPVQIDMFNALDTIDTRGAWVSDWHELL